MLFILWCLLAPAVARGTASVIRHLPLHSCREKQRCLRSALHALRKTHPPPNNIVLGAVILILTLKFVMCFDDILSWIEFYAKIC